MTGADRPAAGLRVVSWNVRSLRDDSAGVAAALRDLHADVVLLQEAPRLLTAVPANRRLASRAGLRRSVGGSLSCGNLLLVSPRVRVLQGRAVRLPKRPGLHRRGAVLAEVVVDGARLGLLGTHLDLQPDARLDSARRLRRSALDLDVPLLLAADLNDEPGSPTWTELSAGLVDLGRELGPTFPQRAPDRRIDALFADPVLEVLAVERPDPGPVTDHLPLVADLRVPRAGRAAD